MFPLLPPLLPTGPTICLRYRSTPLFLQEVNLVGLLSWWVHELKLAWCKESEAFTTINVQRSDDWSRVPLLILHLDTGNLMNTALSALSLDIQIDWAGGPGLAEGIFICLGIMHSGAWVISPRWSRDREWQRAECPIGVSAINVTSNLTMNPTLINVPHWQWRHSNLCTVAGIVKWLILNCFNLTNKLSWGNFETTVGNRRSGTSIHLPVQHTQLVCHACRSNFYNW